MKAHKPAAMTTMRCLSIAAVLILLSQIPLYAGVSGKKKPKPAAPPKRKPVSEKAYKKVTNETALEMLKKYQSIKTYRSVWQSELKQGGQEWKLECETAYERKSGKTLFVIWTFLKKDDQLVPMGGQLLVYDGEKQHAGASQMAGRPMRKKVRTISDPDSFTYRDFRKGLSHVYPVDLPMLYPDHALTEYPLMEILQASLKDIKVTGPDSKAPAKMITLELMTDGTCVRMHLDPKTMIINYFAYFRKNAGIMPGTEFKQVSCEINKPIKPELFDFKTHLKSFEVIKPVEPPKKQQ